MSKVILIDSSVMSFKAAFNAELAAKYRRTEGFQMPSHYTYFSSVLACLKKINVEEGDTVILCIDDKTPIELGEKFAYLIIEGTEMEKLPYHLSNLPAEEEYNEEIDDPFFGRT